MKIFRLSRATAAFGALLFLFTIPGWSAGTQVLRAHVPAVVASLQPTGRFSGTNRLNLAIGLPLRNQVALSNLLRQIYDPASPNYHHYLTPQQFAEQFGPTETDYQAVIAFANANGLWVTATHPNRVLLDVSGSVADVERALHVTMRTYRHPVEDRAFYAPDTEPSLDLAVPVLHISGLDNYSLPHPRFVATPLVNGQNAEPNAGSGPNGTYMGGDFRAAYVPDSSLDGSGQIVGLLQFDGYTVSDITYYERQAGLQAVPLQNVLLDGFSGNPTGSGGEVEVSLDIEMAISMATNLSQVIVYEAGPYGNWHDILNRMATDNLARQLSCSWYEPGAGSDPVADQIWQQMAAQGQSFFNASGDDDAYTGLIDFPGDTPCITQVGGTTLTTSGPGGSWVSEKVWNWGGGIGSGGGISTQYPIPAWQTNVSMTANQGSTTKRNTPDVALTADDVYVRADGRDYNVGGTSCAAPLWAGFAALVNQQAAITGEPSVGFVNPAIYAIGAAANYAFVFHDTITGNNTKSSSPAKFYAVSGYDLCTGWGTPAGQALINALANPEALFIMPPSGFTSAGGSGGPFTITSQTLSLTNAGTNALTWTLANTSSWLTVSPDGGTLTPGGSADMVTVSLNSAASNLVAGIYNATVWFTNLNDSAGQSRQFTLSVINPPVITTQPADEAVLEGTTASFTVAATGGQPLSYQWQDNGTNLADGGNISGSANTNLTINNVSATDGGTYTVVVTNLAGSVTSSNALLTITPSPPVIVMQPTNQTVYWGMTVQFSVGVVGTTPYFYQWNFNGTNLDGATGSMLVLTNVDFDQAGTYAVMVTNIYGSVLSSNATLTVNPPPPCTPMPSGMTAWWSAEGSANDIINGNNGTPMGVLNYTNGEVGQAFVFNSSTSDISVPASPSLNIGTGSGITIECWIKPSAFNAVVGNGGPLIEWDSASADGVNLWAVGGNILSSVIHDTSGNVHALQSANGLLVTNSFQHIALTYDKSSGQAVIYWNGIVVATNNFGSFTPQTTYPVNIGRRTGEPIGNGDNYNGLIDELSLYNRALSSNEIAAIYNAGSSGKCSSPTQPFIFTQPTNQTVTAGSPASFIVVAGGTPPLSYQWNFNGTNIAEATNSSLTLTDAQPANAGTYAVMVTNFYGSVLSSNAMLTVVTIPPFIVSQPSNQTANLGDSATFTVVAGGTLPLSYQWNFNGTNLDGATGSMLVLTNVDFDQAGTYAVMVTNIYGSVLSSNATLTVNPPPPCTPMPSGMTAWWSAEGNADDTINGNNGTPMGALNYTNGEVGQAFVFNASTSYVSVPASSSLNIGTGSGITVECWIKPSAFNAVAGNGGPLIEWDSASADGVNLWADGASSLSSVIHDTSGNVHAFQSANGLLVTNSFQHVALTYDKSSGQAVIYWNGIVVATNNLGSFTPQTTYPVNIGRRTGEPIGNGDNYNGLIDELSLYNRALSSNEIAAIYNAGSSGKCSSPTQPFIFTQPTNQTVTAGSPASFIVVAGGTPPLSYQWNFNGTNIAEATNSSLTLTDAQPANAGTYAVMVTNFYGSVLSSNAMLTVVTIPPFIVSQPSNQTANLGDSATFTVVAGGTLPLSYQWNFNGTNLDGATGSMLVLTNVDFDQAGTYAVMVTNSYGSVLSSNAALTVNPPPPCTPMPSGMAAWWSAENNANDIVNGNNGTPIGALSYTNGEVGQAFVFNAGTSYISVPASSSLNIGTGSGITIECWIKPSAFNAVVGNGGPLIEWDSSSVDGVNLWAVGGNILSSVIHDTSGNVYALQSVNGLLVTNGFQHIALTYDKSSGQAVIYWNGIVVATNNFGSFTPQTTYPVNIGRRTGEPNGNGDNYNGLIDELSLYNRALSSNEIAAIYNAGSSGKCYTPTPPVITTQPTNQTVIVGGTTTFAIQAVGTPPLSYQWNFNGTNIVGATNALLLLTNVQFSQAGTYAAAVTNVCGSAISSNALLTVNPPPSCDPAPSGLVAWWPAEGNANDIVGTNNGTPIGGVTYTSGEVGQAFMFDDVHTGTSYIPLPASPSLNLGTSGGFTIECWIEPNAACLHGGAPIIEWDSSSTDGMQLWVAGPTVNMKDTSGVAHVIQAASNLLNSNNLQHVAVTYDKSSGSAFLYYNGTIIASNNFGNVTPQTTYPVNIGRRTGQPIGNGSNYGGLIDELSLYNRALSSNEIAAIYNAGSSGKCPLPPAILTQPTNQTVAVGGKATFSVRANGMPPLFYQWSFGGTSIPGATNALLTLTNAQPLQAGSYSVLVANAGGSTNSVNAVLTVNTPPGITAQPGSSTNVVGTTASFTVAACGSTPLNYQWKKNGTNLIGATGTNFTIVNVQTNDAGTYSVAITNAFGSVISSNAMLTVLVPPSITLQPASSTNLAGTTATFTNAASGTLPLSYQWQKNDANLNDGGNVSGSAATTLTLAGVSDADAASYTVVVTNVAGSITSSPAILVLLDPPAILLQPTNLTVTVTSNAAFSVIATGSPVLSYQWHFNGTNIFGETNASLTLSNVQLDQAGIYTVWVTNNYGSILSSNATLAVNPLLYFVWNQMTSPRFVNTPFDVVIQAQNLTNGIVTNFTDTVLLLSTNGVPVSPAISGNFIQGVWTGAVAVAQTATNLVLQAVDNLGDSGLANPINVLNLPALTTLPSGGTLLILWPVSPSGFVLETAPDLSPADWVPVTTPPFPIGGQNLLPIQMSETNAFYRLRYNGQ